MKPHSDLAIRLLGLVRRRDTGDPTHDYETAAMIVFLAGVDKVSSLALELLYLAGAVKWAWLHSKKWQTVRPGEIVCQPGFAAKLARLKELGCDLTELKWLSELRNSYIHDCTMFAGYRARPKFTPHGGRVRLHPSGPTIDLRGAFLNPFQPADVERMTAIIVQRLTRCLIRRGCMKALRVTSKRIAALPLDPEPWTERVNAKARGVEGISTIIEALNAEVVGDGCQKIVR
jgi:hypothetical protein